MVTNNTNKNMSINRTMLEASNSISTIGRIVGYEQDLRNCILHVRVYPASFILAFRDIGTCITLPEIIVYCAMCESVSLDIGANFPDKVLPNSTVLKTCFKHIVINKNETKSFFIATCVIHNPMSIMTTDDVLTNP